MNHRIALLPLVLLLSLVILGCEPPTPAANAPPAPPTAATPPPSGQAPLPPETKFGVFAGDVNDLAARPSAPPPVQATPSLPPPVANTERVKAQAGVGAKGHSLGD